MSPIIDVNSQVDSSVLQQELTLHHVGILVEDIEAASKSYRQINGKVSEPVLIASQNVRVCFVDIGGSVALELIEPAKEGISKHLLKRGVTYYHVGYLVSDFDATLNSLAVLGYVQMPPFRSEAFEGRRCSFLMSPVLHLIEIIERGV